MELKAKLSVAGEVIGTGGSSSWDSIKNKPFSTVDTENGLTIQDDTLMIDTLDHIATIDYVDQQIAEIPQTDLSNYYTKSETDEAIEDAISEIDLTSYATKSELDAVEAEIPSLTGYATETYVDSVVDGITTTLETDYATKAELPVATSDLTNDSGFITASALTPYAESANLATVATSGSYNDLTNKPEIYGIGYGTRAHTRGSNLYLDALSGQGLITSQYDGVQLQQGEGVFVTESWGQAIVSCSSPYTSMSINWDAAANLPMAIAIAYTKNASQAGSLYGVIRTGYVHTTDGTDRILEGLEDICTYTNGNTTTSIVLTLNSGLYFTKLSSRTTSSTWALRSYQYNKGWYQSSARNIPIDNSSITMNSQGQLETVIGGGYETVEYADEPISFITQGGANYKTWIADLGILGDEYKEGDVITVTVAGETENLTYTNTYTTITHGATSSQAKGFINTSSTTISAIGIDTDNKACVIGTAFSASGTLTFSFSGVLNRVVKVDQKFIPTDFVPITYDSTVNSMNAGNLSSNTVRSNSIAIGSSNNVTDSGSDFEPVLIGYRNSGSSGAVVVGTRNSTSSSRAIAIGYGNSGVTGYNIVIGQSNNNTGSASLSTPHIVIGKDNSTYNRTSGKTNSNIVIGDSLIAGSNGQTVLGKFNIADYDANYNLILGNGTALNSRNNYLAASSTGIYTAGDIYTNVTDWSDPSNNSIKLANISACPTTTAGTFSLQATVDSNGNVTYNWV